MSLSRFGRAVAAALTAAALTSGVVRAAHAAVTAVKHPMGAVAPATAVRPWSYAWRRQFLATHHTIDHAPDAAGIMPQLSAGRYLYVADYNSSLVFVYNANATTNPNPAGFIAAGVSSPSSVAFDANHNLYVANEGTSTVTIYKPGTTTVAKTIATIFPLSIAIGADGTLYVAGYNGNVPEIEIFAPKAAAPTFIASPNGYEPDAIALTPSNTLLVAANDPNFTGRVFEFAAGASTGTLRLATLGSIDGLAFDSLGNLYAGDFNENAIYEYSPTYTQIATLHTDIARPIGVTIDSNQLFVANGAAAYVSAYTSFAASPTFFARDLTFPTATAVTYVSPAKATNETTIFMSDEGYSEIHRFAANPRNPVEGTLIKQGVDFPQGLWIDDSGKLWAANYAARSVTWFAPGSTVPGGFLNGVAKPFSVTVDHKGNVYVADQSAQNIAVYAKGATRPNHTLSCGGIPEFMAVDTANNLYASCVGQTEDVYEFTAGTTTGTPLGLGGGLNSPRGIAFDAAGNLYVVDFLDSSIFEYAPGSTLPLRTITSGLDLPQQIAIGASGRIYVANTSGSRNPIYAPGGSVPIGIFPADGIGIAVH